MTDFALNMMVANMAAATGTPLQNINFSITSVKIRQCSYNVIFLNVHAHNYGNKLHFFLELSPNKMSLNKILVYFHRAE